MVKRLLVLEDGTVFEGTGFGADTYVSGELVLNSAMTGYQLQNQSLQKPSHLLTLRDVLP